MEAHKSIDLYNRPGITSLDLTCGLADIPFTLTLYIIYTFLVIFKSLLIDNKYKYYRDKITLKLSYNFFIIYES